MATDLVSRQSEFDAFLRERYPEAISAAPGGAAAAPQPAANFMDVVRFVARNRETILTLLQEFMTRGRQA